MDYIQQDLDLIKTASGDVDEDVKKQMVKKKKMPKSEVPSKSEKNTASAKKIGVVKKMKPTPAKIKEETNAKVVEKKRRRKSTSSPALGKIKLPFMKKQQHAEDPELSPSSSTNKMMTSSAKSEKASEIAMKESSTSTPISSKGTRNGGIDPNATPIEAIRFVENAKIEAVDSGKWYKARIVMVDEDKMDVLVHFDGWGARFDTWFPMTSALIRGRTQLDEKPDVLKFEEGEDVLAKWSDGNFYPATVLKVAKSGSYNVMFFDGLKKSLRPIHLKKMTEKEKEEAMQTAQKLLLIPPELVHQESSGSGASPSSDRRRYRTSANDRGRRSNARGQERTPVPVRNAKRKADVLSTPGAVPSGQTSKESTPDEKFIAKTARLDKITTNLIGKVSPATESKQSVGMDATVSKEEETPRSSKLQSRIATGPANEVSVKTVVAKDKDVVPVVIKKVPGRRGRPPKQKVPQVKAPIEVSLVTEIKELPATKVDEGPEKSNNGNDDVAEILQGNISATAPVTAANESLTGNDTVIHDSNMQITENPLTMNSPFQGFDVAYDESPTGAQIYKPGDIVLAKWSDCRSYLAYIIKKETDDSYKIRYYDGHVKVVKANFIYPWVGPLPDKLKIFKPKPPQSKRQRSKSIDLKKGRGRPITKTTGIGRGLPLSAQGRRRTIASVSDAKQDSPVARRRRRRLNDGGFGHQYSSGEMVLAKWTDLRWYPATIVKKMENEHYKVMYADKMTKLVRDTWLSPWTPPKPDDASHQDPPAIERAIEPDASTSPEAVESVEGTSKIPIQFLPGRTVLARYTDGVSYPATVKEKLDEEKYLVEYDNGVVHKVKFSSMNPWSKTALPPLKKKVMRKLYQPNKAETLQKLHIIALLKQEKYEQAMSVTSPKQTVEVSEAYQARSPAPETSDIDHNKFKCKAPGCTKSFRKEEMLRTHHKHYHQQRYKLRDQDGVPTTTKRKTSKDETVMKRRVSADYEMSPKASITAEDVIFSIPKGRGAKPPIEIYQRHHEQSAALTPSFTTASSSSAEEVVKVADKTSSMKQSEISVQPAEAKPSITTTRKRRRSSDAKEEESKVQTAQTDKPGHLPENETDDDDNEGSSVPINEDVIRCTCNVDEEEGFMIQCETCFTWQHAACIGVKQTESKKEKHRDEKTGKFVTVGLARRESDIDGAGKLQPSSDEYICWVCKHPQHGRRNRKYHYNNEFLTKGKLPSFINPSTSQSDAAVNPKVRDVAVMMEEIVKMQESIVGIKNMIKIVSTPNHPLLKTWNEPVSKRAATRSASGNNAPKYPNSQDPSSKLVTPGKPKDVGKKNQPSPSEYGGTNRKTDILRQKENLLNQVSECEAQLENRINQLTDYISKLNENLCDEETTDSLLEDLTTVQRLLKNR